MGYKHGGELDVPYEILFKSSGEKKRMVTRLVIFGARRDTPKSGIGGELTKDRWQKVGGKRG